VPVRTGELTVAEAYKRIAMIRRFEERVLALSREGVVAGSVHLCLGQEAIPVGALAALQPRDRILATYRGHGWALACGSDPAAVMAEIAHRQPGINGGRAGSALLSDPDVGFLGENSIVGAGVPIADGVALASLVHGSRRVVLVSIGDGAMNQGAATEGMVFAAARNLPVIFVCENNGWSEMTPIASINRRADLAERGTALGIESHVVDGTDPFTVRDAVADAAAKCRAGNGPVLLECKTVRLSGHYTKDIEHYRPKDDIAAAAAADPLTRLQKGDCGGQQLDDADRHRIDQHLTKLIDEITAAVREMPPPSPMSALEHLYASPSPTPASPQNAPAELTYQRAVNLALKDELEARPDLLVYGEDVGQAGGIFGVTRSLQKQFGNSRVFDTPISEAAILGSAVGAGLEGVPSVVEIMWADFMLVALDQIINQAANIRYINRSKLSTPLTVRTQQGVTPGSCAQHSQSLEALLAHIPGIKVGLAATPQDAYDMLRAAIADPDPTVLIEHRALYQTTGSVSTGGQIQRAEGARKHRDGRDLAIITWGASLGDVIAAADELAEEQIHATVLDLRWLRPLDDAAIARVTADASGRILIVHEACTTGGFGAEVAARIYERHFGTILDPIRRLGATDVRIPSAPTLQQAVLPSKSAITDTARELAQKRAADPAIR
jgi:2-oxoisovalerate dehydrogenase E1 component